MGSKRIYQLDFIKFCGAVLIIFHHFQQLFEVKFEFFNFFNGNFNFGLIVELFFMISGYVVALKTDSNLNKSFKSFFLNKLARILPMVWISVTFCAFLRILYYFAIGQWGETVGIWQYITSMFLLFKNGVIRIDRLGINNPIWYLSLLLTMYIIYWIIIKVSQKAKINKVYLYILMIITGVSCNSFFLNVPFFNMDTARGLMPFFLGCILADLSNNRIIKSTKMVLFYFLVIISFVLIYFKANSMIDNLQMILVFLIYPALLEFMLTSKVAEFLFNHKAFGEMGKISFEMYLWHVPVIDVIKFLNIKGIIVFHADRAMMFTTTLIIFLVAVFMFYFVEKPISGKTSKWMESIK